MTLTYRIMVTLAIAVLSCILTLQTAHAQSAVAYNPTPRILADMARKGYSETIEDIHVKVLGGYIRVNRTLVGSRWEFNQNWLPAIATSGCGGRKVMRGQYQYNYTSTETVSYQGTDHDADIFTFFRDRRIIAVQDPDNLPPQAIASASGSSGGGGGGPAIGCVDVPVQYLSIRWEDSFGNWIEYDGTNGRTLRYGNRNNVQVSFDYDANGNMEGVNDHFGTRVLTYQYQAGRAVSITDYTNRQVQYVWSADGNTLDKVIDVRGKEWLYTYDGSRRLTKIVDPEGRQKIISIGPTGGVESVIMAEAGETDGVGTSYSYAYDPINVEFTAIQRRNGGREESVTYDKDGFVIRKDLNGTTLYTVDILNGTRKRVRTEHNGNKTTSEYDERNNLIKRTYADSSFITRTYNEYSRPLRNVDEVGTVTSYEYDANGNLERKTEAVGTADEQVIEIDYDQYGQIEELRQLGDTNTQLATTTLTYDNYGNRRTATDSLDELYQWTYDVMGNVMVRTDRRNKLWTQTYDEAGNLRSFTDPNQNADDYDYDGVGNLIRITNAEQFETEFEYDARNNLTAIVDHLDGRIELTYDDNNRITSIRDAEGKLFSWNLGPDGRLFSEVDGAGNETVFDYGSTSIPEAGEYTQPNRIDYPTFMASLEYDRRGRLSRSVDTLANAESLETLLVYDAADRLIEQRNPRGTRIRSPRDAIGRIIKLIDHLEDETVLVYDDRNNLIEVTDPRAKTIRFEYDALDQVAAEIKPLGQRTELFHDEEGNRTRIDDAKGQRVEYGYDDAGRLVSIDHFRDAASTTADRTHSVDYNARGLLETWIDGETSGIRQYDELGRLKSETVDFGDFPLTYSLTYNANSTIDTFSDADGTVYRYVYDDANKPQGLVIPGIGTIAINEFEWLAPKKSTLPGGTTENYQYTSYLEAEEITVSDPAGAPIANRTMTYDAARNVRTKNTEVGDNTYDYDSVNRLTIATRSADSDKSYTYDGMGNRLTLDGAANVWEYDDNNRLTTTGTVTYNYDDNGNVESKDDGVQLTHYFHDVVNRLEQVEDDSGTVIGEYGYDVFGRRVWKEVSGVRTYYLYSPMGLIGEYDSNGTAQKTYGYWPGALWGTRPVFLKSANGYNFYLNDHLGTPYLLTDRDGAITWKAEADPFGATNVSVEIVTNNLRFPGQYFDAETGLHYNYFRTYDPSTGRYLETDPTGLAGGINTYSYVAQNPLRYTDPTGEAIPIVIACAANPYACGALVVATGIAVYNFGQDVAEIVRDRGGRPQGPQFPHVYPPGIFPPPPLTIPGDQVLPITATNTALAECEADCDDAWDRNKFMCDSGVGTQYGRRSREYKFCMDRVDDIYIECLQDCAEECE